MRVRVPVLAVLATAVAISPALADLKITVDKTAQTLTVARDGQILHTWPVSTGRTGHFTPAGDFRAFRMEKDHFSKEFDDAPMPHSIFFTERGHAIHGSFETKKLGRPASSGCVRLAPENAKTLFEMVQAEGVLKTKVEVDGDERVAIARADRQLTQPERRASRGGTGLPPQYAPREEDAQQRAQAQPRRERYAAPQRGHYDQQLGYQQRPYQAQQQQQYYYDGYAWRPYNGGAQRAQQQPSYDQQRPYYPQQQPYYQQRYGYGYGD